MKYFGLLLSSLIGLSAQAAIPEFAGVIGGSLEDVHCTATPPHHPAYDITTVQKRIREKGGFVNGMIVRGFWWDTKGTSHFADFDIVVVNWDVNSGDLQIVGVSPGKNSLELKLNTQTNAATMLINGEIQLAPNLACDTPIAG